MFITQEWERSKIYFKEALTQSYESEISNKRCDGEFNIGNILWLFI